MRIALIGSVSSSKQALESLHENDVDVCCAMGLSPEVVAPEVRTPQDRTPQDRAPQGKADGDEKNDRRPRRVVSDYRDLAPTAEQAGIPYLAFRKVSDPQVEPFLRNHSPDLIWVIGISQLVPDSLINIAPHGGIGFHPTMLPRGRGRAPVAWTILLEETPAVSLFFLTDEADAGDLLAQRAVPTSGRDYAADLIDRTNDVLAEVIKDLAPALKSGNLPRTPQDHTKATFYGKRTPADGLILWNGSVSRIHRLIRAASHPYPGAFTSCNGGEQEDAKLIIWRAETVKASAPSDGWLPGRIHSRGADDSICVECADGMLRMTDYQCADPARLMPGVHLG